MLCLPGILKSISSVFSPMQLLAPLLLMLFSAGLAVFGRFYRAHKELGWMALGFFCFAVGLLVQVAQLARWPHVLLPFVLGFSICHLCGAAAVAQALAVRLQVKLSRKVAAVLALVLLAEQTWFSVVQPSTAMRVYCFSVGAMCMMALPLWHWRTMQARNHFDDVLRWCYVVCIVINLLRAGLLMPAAHGVALQNLTQTWYWMAMHFTALITGPMLALSLVLAVVWDVICALKSEGQRDLLTQALNRSGFEDRLRQLRARHIPGPWCLLVCDLDHFKRINDRWGHAVGDQVLKVVAQHLQQHTHDHDVLARYGGEEFVFLLQGVEVRQAQWRAERLRQDLAQLPLLMLGGRNITLSIGLATVHSLAPADMSAAFLDADAQLYQAKRAGRNRIAVKKEAASAG